MSYTWREERQSFSDRWVAGESADHISTTFIFSIDQCTLLLNDRPGLLIILYINPPFRCSLLYCHQPLWSIVCVRSCLCQVFFLWWLMINIMRASSSWNLWPHRVKIRISHRVLISARALEINVITLARCWYIRSIRQRPVGKHSAPAPRPSGAWPLRADPCTVKVSLWCLAAAAEIKPFHLLVLRATVVVRIRDEERVGINATRRQTIDQPWKM